MDGVKAALVLFVAGLLQLVVLTQYSAFRSASLVLVTLLAIALLRGSVFGAAAGFTVAIGRAAFTRGKLVIGRLHSTGDMRAIARSRDEAADGEARFIEALPGLMILLGT